MHKRSLKMAAIFAALVFGALTLTMLLAFLVTAGLYRSGVVEIRHRETALLVVTLVSILVGTMLSRWVGKRPIGFIEEISAATKQVAKGNFHVSLPENTRITELRDMAQNFNIMTKELVSTELLRKDFIENVSHEFKTPLAAIEGYTTLLQQKGLSEEKRLQYTTRIMLGVKRLSALTGNILLLSRLENQEIAITKECFSVDEQLRETILLFADTWGNKELELDIELDPVEYCGNKDLLGQVWQNIFDNALKFTPHQGRIAVRLQQCQGAVQVVVADNGVGIAKEALGRVYEKFYQGDASRGCVGNGLGLALAKRIVDLHQGDMTITSKEGAGTQVTVCLKP